jgi:gliding motility-associated-like protein
MTIIALQKTTFLFFLFLFLTQYSGFAQLPQCNLVYLDQYFSQSGVITSTEKIYNYNPAQPVSAANPALNTIQLPSTTALGLTVSEVLASGNTTLTFYTVINDYYWYYNPVTAAWVNTYHTTGSSGTAINIASGGGFIYNLSGSDGKVYVYNGTSNGSLLVTISDFIDEGPWDLIADCAGNFYILNVTGVNYPPFLRKYSSNGTLLHSWTINNPNNYFLGNGYGLTAGFGIIGATIYVDNLDLSGTKYIVSGTINTNTIDFTGPPVALPYPSDDYPGDFGSCASSVPAVPQITITASATTITSGTVVTFTAAVNSGGNQPLYQWYVNGVPVNGATEAAYTYAPNPNDVITCQLTSNLPCASIPNATSNAITITVEGCPSPTLSYDHTLFCKSNFTTVPLFSPGGGTFSASTAGLDLNSNDGSINIGSSNLGTYVITYTIPANTKCPALSIRDTITISVTPDVHIDIDEAPLCENEIITLRTQEAQGNAYQWSPKEYFPSGDSSATVTVKVVAPGTIYLNVVNANGCNAGDSIELKPEHCCYVMIPSAFSPNGDGLNDVFKINSNTIQELKQFSVYNRWGERVFSTINQSSGWDGSYKNKPADPGVYFYYLDYNCSNGMKFIKKGDVTLIR